MDLNNVMKPQRHQDLRVKFNGARVTYFDHLQASKVCYIIYDIWCHLLFGFMQWFEMTLNYQMTVERHPNPNEGVGGSIHGCEIFSLLDGIKPRAHSPQGRQ